ncbi:MAG: peptidase, partial [Labilithrix sp.]|nr:peptidase [Labilithrix sp.]
MARPRCRFDAAASPAANAGGTTAAATGTMNRRLRLGRIFGVEVSLDWSWIFAFVLAAWTIVSLNRRLLPDLDTVALALVAVAAAAGLFASLGAHELVRVRATRAKGVPVRRLTLFVIGGV